MSLGHIYDTNLYTDDECNRINVKVGTLDSKSAVVTSLNLPRGTKTAPTVTFSTDTTSGYYSSAANNLDFTISGNSILNLSSGDNLRLGYNTDPLSITSANYNINIGKNSGSAYTSSSMNVVLGWNAGPAITTGGANTIVGKEAGKVLSTGANCSYFGRYAGGLNVSGSSVTALGESCLQACTASNNTGVGASALFSTTSGTNNVALGSAAGYSNVTGIQNAYIGTSSGYLGVGSNNVGVGYQSLYNNTNANNTALGSAALYNNTSGNLNTAVGYLAAFTNQTGLNNVHVGAAAGYLSTGNNCTSVGYNALYNNTAASITAVGYRALFAHTSGTFNSALGYQAGAAMLTASSNCLFGYNAGLALTTSGSNILVGVSSGAALTTGSGGNVGVGHQTLQLSATSATANVAIGTNTLQNCDAANNTCIGDNCAVSLVTGASNIIIGKSANCGAATTGLVLIGNSISSAVNNTTTIYNPVANQGLYMNSLRNVNNASYVEFNSATNELTYNAAAPSSTKYKENFRQLELKDIVGGIDVYTFDYNDAAPDQYKGKKSHGVKAQEVERYFPEACKYVRGVDGVDELYTVNYEMLVVPLWREVKELRKRLELLEEKEENTYLESNDTRSITPNL